MFRVFAAFRDLLAYDDGISVEEYEKDISSVFTKMVSEKLLKPIYNKRKNNASPEERENLKAAFNSIVKGVKNFNWSGYAAQQARKMKGVRLDEFLSELFIIMVHGGKGFGEPVYKTLPLAILKKYPDLIKHEYEIDVPVRGPDGKMLVDPETGEFVTKKQPKTDYLGWKDIAAYWGRAVNGVVVEMVRKMTHSGRLELKDPTIIEEDEAGQSSNDVVTIDEVEDSLGDLQSYLVRRARTPEEAKLFKYLLKAIASNDFLTDRKRKKFTDSIKKLDPEAPNRDNEDFWRAVWDRMRIHVCSFFKKMFEDNDTRMTKDQEKMICSSESGSVVDRVARSEFRRNIAAYVLGISSIKDSVDSGDFMKPHAMVEELRAHRNRQAMIDRIANSIL
jgi:hypothetical protein